MFYVLAVSRPPRNALRYRFIRLCYDVIDVNNTESFVLRVLAARFTANMELPKPELPGVKRVTPGGVTLEVVGRTTQVTNRLVIHVSIKYVLSVTNRAKNKSPISQIKSSTAFDIWPNIKFQIVGRDNLQ